jgi:ELWxxDGT repeat protein
MNGTLLFSASDADHGRELWRSDGTPEGTVLIKDLEAGPGSSGAAPLLVTPSLVLLAACPAATGCELYRTDGTDAGTILVMDIDPGPDSGFSSAMGRLGEVLIFGAHEALGWAPYRSDGTPDGTFRLGPPPVDTQVLYIDTFGVLKGSLYFRKVSSVPTGAVLWKTDGTSEGTVAVAPLPGTYSSEFPLSAALDDVLVFLNDDGTIRHSLWKTDGTAAGTSMLASVGPVGSLVRLGPRIVYWAWDDAHGIEPWTTDGTAAGTALLKDIYPGRKDSSSPESTAVLGSSLFFWANDGVHGFELWKTDGTSAGTTLVRDIAPGPASSHVSDRLVSTGREAYFFAADPVSGPELWRTDGTEEGTTRVADVNPGLAGSDVARNRYWKEPLIARSGGRVFFTATDGTTGYELWSLPIPLGFHPVTPCRVADTRDPGGPAGGVPLGASQTLILPVAGRCGIPSTAISVAANVTVVSPSATGTLSVFAGGPIVSGTTEVPVIAGKTRALNAIPLLGTAGSLSVRADLPAGSSTEVILDVSGYFE